MSPLVAKTDVKLGMGVGDYRDQHKNYNHILHLNKCG